MSKALKNRTDVTVVLMIFISLAIIGVIFGGYFVRDYAKARSSAAWPVVSGIVLSRIDKDENALRYVYSFDGRTYESERERVFTAQFMKPQSTNYLPGETVRVYVNPENPQFAVLQPGGAGVAFVLFSLLSGMCIFFGIGGVVWTLSEGAADDFAMVGEATYQ